MRKHYQVIPHVDTATATTWFPRHQSLPATSAHGHPSPFAPCFPLPDPPSEQTPMEAHVIALAKAAASLHILFLWWSAGPALCGHEPGAGGAVADLSG